MRSKGEGSQKISASPGHSLDCPWSQACMGEKQGELQLTLKYRKRIERMFSVFPLLWEAIKGCYLFLPCFENDWRDVICFSLVVLCFPLLWEGFLKGRFLFFPCFEKELRDVLCSPLPWDGWRDVFFCFPCFEKEQRDVLCFSLALRRIQGMPCSLFSLASKIQRWSVEFFSSRWFAQRE